VGAYALDKAHPARLQLDLIERYLEHSIVWYRLIADKELIQADKTLNVGLSDGNPDESCTQFMSVSTSPALGQIVTRNSTIIDGIISTGSYTHHVELKRESQGEDRSHSILKGIKLVKAELEILENEYTTPNVEMTAICLLHFSI
jgi:hypothetical protein